MRHTHLDYGQFFDVRLTTDGAQLAEMTLEPGQSTGGPENYHATSDQWLYVVSGTGVATVDGDEPLETLNLYVPPAY